MKLSYVILAFSIVFLVLALGCTQQPEAPPVTPPTPPVTTPPVTTPTQPILPPNEQPQETGPGITERPDYLNETWFAQLPPFPQDLYKLRSKIKYGEFWDMASIDARYYLQPEFYPTFEAVGLPLLQKRSGTSPYGFGAYPGDIQIITFANDNITVATFFFSQWGVESYQGMGLAAKVTDDKGNPSDKVLVELVPDAIVLGPTWPAFVPNWAAKVVTNLHVAKDAPIGTYIISIDPSTTPADMSAKWSAEYGGLYTEGGMFRLSIDRPYFKITLTVT